MIIMGEFAYEHSGKDLLLHHRDCRDHQFYGLGVGSFLGRIKFTLTEERK